MRARISHQASSWRGLVRHQRDHGIRTAFAAQNVPPEPVRGGGEDVRFLCGEDDPRALLELALQLTRPPAGIAGEDTDRSQVAELAGLVDLAREEADVADHDDLGPCGVGEVRQDDHRLRLDGAPR